MFIVKFCLLSSKFVKKNLINPSMCIRLLVSPTACARERSSELFTHTLLELGA